MTANLVTFDFFEQAMLMMGWLVSNAVTDVFHQTGLALFPFLALIIKEWFEAKHEGEEAGNKGVLSLNRVEMGLYIKLIVYFFTVVPLFTVSFSPINIDHSYSSECGTDVVSTPEGAWDNTTVNMIGGSSVKIPAWWGIIHAISHGVTNMAIGQIPCTPDLQAITTELDLNPLQDPMLKNEVNQFQRQCFGQAMAKAYYETPSMSEALAEDVGWIGSEYLRNTSGYYDSIKSSMPIEGFTYDATRDSGMANTGPGLPGYPTCKEWWEDSSSGLRNRLYNTVSPSVIDRLTTVFSDDSAEDAVIRRIVTTSANAANGNQHSATDYSSSKGANAGVFDPLLDVVSYGAGAAGSALISIPFMAGMDMVKQALPMIQKISLLAIVIVLPFVSLLSSYSVTVVGTATIGIFSIIFLTFWWQLARWLTTNLVSLVYSSEAAQLSWLAGAGNAYDTMVLKFVEGAAFLFLPMLWVGTLTWAGFKGGSAITNSLSSGSSAAKSAGEKGGQAANKAVSKGAA